jgi:hypothetical protein
MKHINAMLSLSTQTQLPVKDARPEVPEPPRDPPIQEVCRPPPQATNGAIVRERSHRWSQRGLDPIRRFTTPLPRQMNASILPDLEQVNLKDQRLIRADLKAGAA